MVITGERLGFRGGTISLILASLGTLPPFWTLQSRQQHTVFSHVFFPPRDRGITWSRLSCEVENRLPQYWHLFSSRAKIFFRLNFTVCGGSFE